MRYLSLLKIRTVVVVYVDHLMNNQSGGWGNDSDDDGEYDDILRAQALAASEDLVVSFARANGLSFNVALGQLLANGTLTNRMTGVKYLNFNDGIVRGGDLNRTMLSVGKFCKNEYKFNNKLKLLLNAKSDYDLSKKIGEFEFDNPLLLIGAMGVQMTRLENRYILNGTTFLEAYIRKSDQFRTLLCMIFDLYEFGIDKNIKNQFLQFSSDIINPKFDLNTIIESNIREFVRNDKIVSNSNSDALSINPFDASKECFTFDGNSVIYNVNPEFGNKIDVLFPMYEKYQKHRMYIGNEEKNTIFSNFGKNIKPKFTSNGACWNYNFGVKGCPHAVPCTIKGEAHALSHFCAVCDGRHPILTCPFCRSNMLLCTCNVGDWFTRTYSTFIKNAFGASSYNRNNNNRGGRSYNGRYNNNRNNSYSYHNGRNDSYNGGYHGGSSNYPHGHHDRDSSNYGNYGNSNNHSYGHSSNYKNGDNYNNNKNNGNNKKSGGHNQRGGSGNHNGRN